MAFSTYQLQRFLARFFRRATPQAAIPPPPAQNSAVRVRLSPQAHQAALHAQQAWQRAEARTHQRPPGPSEKEPPPASLWQLLERTPRPPAVAAEIERRAASVLSPPPPGGPPPRIPKTRRPQQSPPRPGSKLHRIS